MKKFTESEVDNKADEYAKSFEMHDNDSFTCFKDGFNSCQEELQKLESSEEKRSCYTCSHINVCKAFDGLQKAMNGMPFNVDGEAEPGSTTDVYDALGNCCTLYTDKKLRMSLGFCNECWGLAYLEYRSSQQDDQVTHYKRIRPKCNHQYKDDEKEPVFPPDILNRAGL